MHTFDATNFNQHVYLSESMYFAPSNVMLGQFGANSNNKLIDGYLVYGLRGV